MTREEYDTVIGKGSVAECIIASGAYINSLETRIAEFEEFYINRNEAQRLQDKATGDVLEYFEARIAELEAPKSCDGCKHMEITEHRNYYYEIAICRNERCKEMYDRVISDNFYCSYYEPKDIENDTSRN
jgi:hypothetical protein